MRTDRRLVNHLSPARMSMLLALVFALLASGTALAKEMVSVRISGPGIEGQLEFFDERTMQFFRNLETSASLTEEPEGLSDLTFEIQIGVGDGTQVFAYNVYHYSPLIDGSAGFLYYADVINGMSSAEKTWFPLSAESDLNLRKFLASHGGSGALIGLLETGGNEDAEPTIERATPGDAVRKHSLQLWLAGVSVGVLAVSAAWSVRKFSAARRAKRRF